jgi:YD repeat-containing protein
VTDSAGNRTSNSYDLRGNKTLSGDPDMGAWSYVSDAFGELYTQTDAKSQTTVLSYDAIGRAVQRSEPDTTSKWTFGTSLEPRRGQADPVLLGQLRGRRLCARPDL